MAKLSKNKWQIWLENIKIQMFKKISLKDVYSQNMNVGKPFFCFFASKNIRAIQIHMSEILLTRANYFLLSEQLTSNYPFFWIAYTFFRC